MRTAELTLLEAADLVRDGAVSPVELTTELLQRIEAVDRRLKAFETVTPEPALEAARIAEKEIAGGRWRGPLHGIPIAVKDLYDTAGIPTTASSKVWADRVPGEDAACVQRLSTAGAVVLGKTRTHEFAFGVETPPTCNPWDAGRIPGGSSGGSAAAVASRLCFLALGTDTGGSIRTPAAFCGVVGIKPTYGRVSLRGVTPLSWSLDHAGPMARSVADVAVVLGVLAGHDPLDPVSVDVPVPDYLSALDRGVDGLVVGVPDALYFDKVQPDVERLVREALAELERQGARLRPVTIPYPDIYLALEFGIVLPEASAFHQRLLRHHAEKYQPDVRMFLEAGELILATDYLQAQRMRAVVKQAWRSMFEDGGVDVVVAPSLPLTAPPVGRPTFTWHDGVDEDVIPILGRFMAPGNVTGLPAVSVPCGFGDDGLPVGLQVLGRPFAEETVLRVAHAYEQSVDWRQVLPPLAR